MSQRQRSDTCRKPGTAFATEYSAPGADTRTSGFLALRLERTLESTTGKPSSLHDAPMPILLFSADPSVAKNSVSHVCRESMLPTGRNTSARRSPKRLQVAFACLQHGTANDLQP
eukprot:740284-Amphidinium_carterae.1